MLCRKHLLWLMLVVASFAKTLNLLLTISSRPAVVLDVIVARCMDLMQSVPHLPVLAKLTVLYLLGMSK